MISEYAFLQEQQISPEDFQQASAAAQRAAAAADAAGDNVGRFSVKAQKKRAAVDPKSVFDQNPDPLAKSPEPPFPRIIAPGGPQDNWSGGKRLKVPESSFQAGPMGSRNTYLFIILLIIGFFAYRWAK
jgi:hypothetical protein